MFVDIKADELRIYGTTLYGTLFTGLSIEKLDMSQAALRKSSMRDGDIMEMNLKNAILDKMYFYRVMPLKTMGIETVQITM